MASIPAIRQGLQARLATISGLNRYDVVPGTIVLPAALVVPAPGDFLTYDESVDGADSVLMVISLFVALRMTDEAQRELDAYLADSGASSIRAAVNGDMTLGGAAHYAVVTGARNYGLILYNQIEYLGCEFPVTVGTL